jgi:hypothetical protein
MEFYKNKQVKVSKKDEKYAGTEAYYQFHFDSSNLVMLCDKKVSESAIGPFNYFSVEEELLEELF